MNIIRKGREPGLQSHYQNFGKISVDSDFDANWKEVVRVAMAACQSHVRMIVYI